MKTTWIFLGLFLICANVKIILGFDSTTGLYSSFITNQWPEEVIEKFREHKTLFAVLTGKYLKDDMLSCVACNLLFTGILLEKNYDMTSIQLSSEAEYFCEILGLESTNVCDGVIYPHVDVLSYIIDNKKEVNSQQICSLIMKCDQGNETFNWTIDIPDGTPAEKVPDGNTTFKVGHITDIHFDPLYTEGKVADCHEPLCCQNDQADATKGEDACGHFGTYKQADAPQVLLEEALDQLAQQKPEFVYFTGDLVSHRVWGTSPEFNGNIIKKAMGLFAEKLGNIPVYPILGNHEAHPVNLYAPLDTSEDEISSDWLYDVILDTWTEHDWLDKEAVKKTILAGGYYTVKTARGLRLIVLNNNVCSRENWWNLYNSEDPYGQLKWLADTLLEAEKNKEIVHILYHIQTSSCIGSWGRAYNQILKRFQNTIAAQFNGHTHRDQFFIHYDNDTNENNMSTPIGVTFNGGSLMPDEANPNYKILSIDANSFNVKDFETYTFDLDEANKNQKIDWIKLYSFKDSFHVDSLSPADLSDLVINKMKNDTVVDLYNRFFYRGSSKANQTYVGRDLRCQILLTVEGEADMCNHL
ncbi:sphingomyelin phosphodiesterase isoform X1 [Diabrotica virgifera virgifera]|uniref:Sphingomyelin phosphodiesterase n=2 Tax=Diabrotica virgifera virgifera TaxID=50390 RepID=A0ABM5JIU9_DIAVI|nr:sphingomyelin phosphodiesterase isoform X1 [Diabrotica virgifera virgifera]